MVRSSSSGSFFAVCTFLLGCFFAPFAIAQAESEPGAANRTEAREPVKVAVVVRNRAGEELDRHLRTFEDLIAGEVTGLGVQVISREDVLESLGTYEGRRSEDAVAKDQLFSDNTSGLRLAQNLGADYLLTATILSSSVDEQTFTGYGVETTSLATSIGLHYRILDRAAGKSLIADNIEVTRKQRIQKGSRTSTPGLTLALLKEATEQIAASLESQLHALPEESETLPAYVNVTIDAVLESLSIPDVVRSQNGEYTVTPTEYRLTVAGAEVEVNGLMIGSTSSKQPLQVPPGINNLRLARPGYQDVVRTVNFFEGQTLTVSMQMDQEGIDQLKEMADFFQSLERDAKLTDAEVKRLEGFAQYLSQSGMRIDYRTDTTEPIQLNQTVNSLFAPSELR